MGCWNATCGLTNTPIMHGERAVVIPLVQISTEINSFYCNDICNIAGFAIRGTYNDYGALEKVDDTIGAQETVRLFNNSDKIYLEIPEHKKRYSDNKDKIKDAETLIKLIERGNCKSVSGKNLECTVSFIMMHEEAFDKIVKETGSRKGYKNKQKFAEHLLNGLKERQEKSKNVEKSFFLNDDAISRWLKDFFFKIEFVMTNSIPETLYNSFIEIYLFQTAMNLLRKNITPQCGSGSQCAEIYMHKILADFVVKRAKTAENLKETFLF